MNSTKLNFKLEYGIIILISSIGIISWSDYGYGQSLSNNDTSVVSELLDNFKIVSESDSPSSEFMSDQSSTNFSNFDSSDFVIPQFSFPDVNGTYINSDIGYEIELPQGWKGKEFKFMMDMVFATPNEINLDQIEEQGTIMTISGIDKDYFDMLTGLTNLQSFEGGSNEQLTGLEDDEEVFQDTDASNPASDNIMDSCTDFQTEPVTVNGISAEQIIANCIDENGEKTKAKEYAFATSDDSIILISFYSDSITEFNKYLPLFEESVKTIKITNPDDIAKSEIYKKYKLELQSNKTIN